MDESYDVVVVGGGAAGLSGAMMLGRVRRSVLVVDAGQPRNAPADGVHGLLGHDGRPPGELLELGRAEVRRYGVDLVEDEVVDARREGEGFTVGLRSGARVRARRLLVTAGLVDELPDVPGVAERWGHDVLHCPYCHGWEVRDRRIAVLATSAWAVHHALLFARLSDDVVVLGHTAPPLEPEQRALLDAVGVPVLDGEVGELVVEDDRLVGARLASGEVVPCDAVVVATRMVARAGFLAGLGLHPEPHPTGMGEHLVVDETGRTTVPGVWAAGNVTDLAAQVGASAAQGAWAGAQINADLVMGDATAAVAAAAGGA